MNEKHDQNAPRRDAWLFGVVVGLLHASGQIAVFLLGLATIEMETPVLDCIAFVVALPFVLPLDWLENHGNWSVPVPLVLVAAVVDSVLWGIVAWAVTKRFETR